MSGKRLRIRFIALAGAASLALVVLMGLGVIGLQRLNGQAAEAAERSDAGLSTLMLVAGLRDQVRAQHRAAGRAEAPAAELFERHHAAVQQAIERLGAAFGAQNVRLVGEAHRDWVNAIRSGDSLAAGSLQDALLDRLEKLSRGALAVYRDDAARNAAARRDGLVAFAGALVLLACGGAALTLGFGLRLAGRSERELGGDPAVLAEVARDLAAGHLDAADRLDSGNGEDLSSALRAVALAMQRVVDEVRGNAEQLLHAAETLTLNTAQIAAGSNDQLAATAGMASSVGQMSASISQVNEHSHTALRISRESGELSEEASGVVISASGELEGVAESARELTEIIQTLGQRSSKISSIVSVIQDIANQTNLLALNAAIEAARAGEQGRGFSVVADEVRKLADRTTESTREISGMILAIQEGTAQAVGHMDKWGLSVTGGVAKAQGAGARMEKIRSGALEVMEAVDRVSGALAEQSSASSEIAAAVDRIAAMSQQGNESVGALNGTAQTVAQLAASLGALASRFRGGPLPA